MYRLDIAEVARRSGFPPSTLRYYEKRGLIKSDGRQGLRRQYDDAVMSKLALIALGQRAGFSLDDLSGLLNPPEERPHLDRDELRGQARNLRDQAQELRATADLLDHIAACSAPSHWECPRFQSLLAEALETRSR